MGNWLGSSLNQTQGWTTVQESYSPALEQGPLCMMLVMPTTPTTVVVIIILAHYCIWQHAAAEILALKQESRILGQWSTPVFGSRKSQASSK